MNPLLELSAVELAARIRARDVSPVEVVETHVRRIEEVNGRLNAVVRPLFAAAHAEARAAERRLLAREADLPPFLGVPFTSKEHLEVRGLPNTGGLVRRRGVVAPRDATVVARMRQAGFVLLGTTNVPEGLTWYECYNKVYGRTSNAYSARHTPGGSSGGEGAIIGAGGSPIGIGGDMGGSIRLPAFFNGIAGHKPSGGRMPETGAWPGARGLIARYKVLGPMARRVSDLRAVMPILARPDGQDLSVDGPAWAEESLTPRDVRVFYFDDNGVMRPSAGVSSAVRESAAALGRLGCAVEPWRPTHLERGFQMWANALAQSGGPKFNDVIADGGELDLLREWLRWPVRRSAHTFPVLALAALEKAIAKAPKWGKQMADLRHEMQREIEEKLGPNGVLVCPVFHRAAPRHGLHAMLHFLGFTYSGTFNPLELPSTAVPTGFDDGLPVGVQVLGARNRDVVTLTVAGWLEQVFGGWRPPWRLGD